MQESSTRIYIAKNNLKLNIVINLFLIVTLIILFYFDWYCHFPDEGPKGEVIFYVDRSDKPFYGRRSLLLILYSIFRQISVSDTQLKAN